MPILLPTEVDDGDGRIKPGWMLIGTGAALAATGLTIDLVNLDIQEDLQTAYDASNWARADALERKRDRVRVFEYVFYGSAVAASVAGLTWLLMERGPDSAAPVVDRVGVVPTRGGLAFEVAVPF